MPKFDFQLEGVLRERKNAEQQRQREVAVVQTKFAALQAELRELDQTVRAAEQELRDKRLLGRLDLSFLAAHRRFSFAMQRKALGLAQNIATVQVKLNEMQRKLIEAVKRRKAIEKLKEKQFQRWREEKARHEMLEMDEVALQMGRLAALHEQAMADAQLDDQAGVA
jgi:flagellar FliJ protein